MVMTEDGLKDVIGKKYLAMDTSEFFGEFIICGRSSCMERQK